MSKQQTKKVPELRFPEFSGDWEEKKLGDISKVFDGTHQTPKYVENGVKFFSVENVTNNNFENTKYVSEEVYKKEKSRVVPQKNDILMTRIGDIGTSKLIDWDVKASFYVSLALIRISDSNFPSFINQIIKSKNFQKELWRRTIHVAFPRKINLGDIGKSKINLPSKPEQEKVAGFLSSVDERVGVLENRLELLRQYKKGLMQKIFNQTIRFTKEDGTNYPDWQEKNLSDISKERKEKNNSLNVSEVFSVAKTKGVINQIKHLGRSFASKDLSGYKIIRPNDVIYTKSPTSNFPYGIIKQNKTGRVGVVSQLYCILIPNNKYIGYILDSYFNAWQNTYNYLNPIVEKGAKNTMNINNSVFINGNKKTKFNFSVNEDEQKKIADFLSSVDEKIENLSKQISETKKYKKSLLQKMLI